MWRKKKKRRDPKVYARRNQATLLNAEKMRKRDNNIMRGERREMSRNDIDAVENMPDEDPPTPTEAAPALQIQEVEQKHCVGDYVHCKE